MTSANHSRRKTDDDLGPDLPQSFSSEADLETFMSRPAESLIESLRRWEGDLIILGVAGKMGVTLALTAQRAVELAGIRKRIIGAARFSNPQVEARLQQAGIQTIRGDVLDRSWVSQLPRVDNVMFMVGRKFGTDGSQSLTWATNVLAPSYVLEHFPQSRIVAFSTGNVYPLVSPKMGGCTEADEPNPVGEYGQSCLGRERVFQYFSRRYGTPVCLLRLNYAIDLRYGVLHDIARNILEGRPVELHTGYFNCLWQGDANTQALRAFEQCTSPATVLNLTGPETLSVRDVAQRLAQRLGRDVSFAGTEGPVALLNNAGQALRLFGAPTVSLDQMIAWTADWLLAGGKSLNKPTRFEVHDGKF